MKTKSDEPEDLQEALEDLQRKLERLRVMYEQYFLGVQKRPPTFQLQEVVRLFHSFGQYHIKKATHKFKLSSLHQRFNTHRAYWQRIMREIENGTYKRDRARAQRREMRRSGEPIDTTELAKRALLGEMKGAGAVEARKRHRAEAGGEVPYVPAVQRRVKRGRRAAKAIRGASADSLEARLAEPQAEASAEFADDEPTQPNVQQPAASTQGTEQPAGPSANADPPPGEAVFDLPFVKLGAGEADKPTQRAPTGNQRSTRPVPPSVPPVPPVARTSPPPTVPPVPPQPRTPAARRAPAVPGARGGAGPPARLAEARAVLNSAGMDETRTRNVYNKLVEARRRAGQSTESLTYDRIVTSLARQVPKLQQVHGAQKVGFNVVTKGDRVFIKPNIK